MGGKSPLKELSIDKFLYSNTHLSFHETVPLNRKFYRFLNKMEEAVSHQRAGGQRIMRKKSSVRSFVFLLHCLLEGFEFRMPC